MRRELVSVKELSERFGKSEAVIFALLWRRNIQPFVKRQGHKPSLYWELDVAFLAQHFEAEKDTLKAGMTAGEIARKMHCSDPTVHNAAVRLGLKIAGKKAAVDSLGRTKLLPAFSSEDAERICDEILHHERKQRADKNCKRKPDTAQFSDRKSHRKSVDNGEKKQKQVCKKPVYYRVSVLDEKSLQWFVKHAGKTKAQAEALLGDYFVQGSIARMTACA